MCGDSKMVRRFSLEIDGMHCNSCAKIIEQSLSKLDGVEEAKVSFPEEKAELVLNTDKASISKVEGELNKLGYKVRGSPSAPSPKTKTSLREGIVYGLVPHIGCIGFIAASILGVTVAVEFFRPLLMNPWFFHILILIALAFATASSAFYLRKNQLLSWAGVKRKKKYLATMYGSTVGINLVLFLLVFPMLANLDTGSFAEAPNGAIALAAAGQQPANDSLLKLQVNIPCPGHAPLISGELKTIGGVTGVRFEFPNYFDIAFDSSKTSKEDVLALEVFETYPAVVVSKGPMPGSEGQVASLSGGFGLKEVAPQGAVPASGASCGGSCGGGCGGSAAASAAPSCACGAR